MFWSLCSVCSLKQNESHTVCISGQRLVDGRLDKNGQMQYSSLHLFMKTALSLIWLCVLALLMRMPLYIWVSQRGTDDGDKR